ncbi:hypothetical protein S7711_08969 [Stachybotrys chartarum IBT 7711]|uniref:Uncharacterized protein n=1 Tax=Stachybotrys chartarum (strain CBS 109288 / IBT 7711) TaxID=1280523 RepID=A0A084AQJ3_STACB|nr:hypothetical protein S7711_08969 [Stachybotrys chartarum IBT 7711]KFA47271.1 hypothetical protein S40293_05484 [Stachybotrys chartarum IBT 40293]
MTLRRCLGPRSPLTWPTPPAARLRDPLPLRLAPGTAVGRSRLSFSTRPALRQATPYDSHSLDHRHYVGEDEGDGDGLLQPEVAGGEAHAASVKLDKLLSAIRRKDVRGIFTSFTRWTDALGQDTSPLHNATVAQVHQLPAAVFSEIIRSVDPIRTPSLDAAHGLTLSVGQTSRNDSAQLVDEFGVRRHHLAVLRGVGLLMIVRSESPTGLLLADYDGFFRCAGAALDFDAMRIFWRTVRRSETLQGHTVRTWGEFLKAIYMTDPVYYQYDRSRVAVMARDAVNHGFFDADLSSMEHLRFSLNALKKNPWNRRRDEVDEDVRRYLRRRAGFKSFRNQWIRGIYAGYHTDEELVCTSMVAFSRSTFVYAIKLYILKPFYDIEFRETDDPSVYAITGGREIPASSPLRPTTRLLDAIVEAFGTMSYIPLAQQLLQYVSNFYNIPIPHHTWSNLLNWAFVSASKPFSTMRKMHPALSRKVVDQHNVREIWNTMTSAPYSVTPSFQDYDIHIKLLILERQPAAAIDCIREQIMPLYHRAVTTYQNALLDEILRNDVKRSPAATHRREQAQIRKDDMHYRIGGWLRSILKTLASKPPFRHEPSVVGVVIPNILLEFADFFPEQVTYRTHQGVVELQRPDAIQRYVYRRKPRRTIPQKKAAVHTLKDESRHDPDYSWPQIRVMNILEWQPSPRLRRRIIGRPPLDKESPSWWAKLARDMRL